MIAVFTPTRLFGGLDVAVSSLIRQRRRDILWIVADELVEDRKGVWDIIRTSVPFDVELFRLEKQPGFQRNLAASYNKAMEIARARSCAIFVSMQDYFWIPDDGLDSFEALAMTYPNDLFTGTAHLTARPSESLVTNPYGLFTVFERPYTLKPPSTDLWREDVRPQDALHETTAIEWETNWAALGSQVLYSELTYDEEFDRGVAYENQDFAMTCITELGSRVIHDTENVALGLPHKLYFPGIHDPEAAETHVNRERVAQKWGI